MNKKDLEIDLYEPMRKWLQQLLIDKYKHRKCEIDVVDSHAVALDTVLEKYGVVSSYPQAVGLDIQIDVLGIVKLSHSTDLFFIEAKKTDLNLHDLGQLWAYCKLINPSGAYLLSSKGLGSLSKILLNLGREDLLDFGNGKIIKKMQVAKWDKVKGSIDNNSVIPKI